MWEMNWIAVLLSAGAGFLVGGIWYGPLFGKAWQREQGLSDESIRGVNMPKIFGMVIVLNLFAAFILGHVLATYGQPNLFVSTIVGGGIGLGFIATSLGVNYLFALKSFKLFAIDACYWTLVYAVMGAIFGLVR
ncbi:MAG: DUF1761 domain-containing protein [Novosphingobium sp.]|nr:DUF1761 domain-containing protein [Novosphingobium sp.]